MRGSAIRHIAVGALFAALAGCAGVSALQPSAGPTRTPYVIVITATPAPAPGGPSPTPTPLMIGPFGPTFIPPQAVTPAGPEPTLDLSDLTPGPAAAQPTPEPAEALPGGITIAPEAPRSERLGLNFVSGAHHDPTEARLRVGVETGIGWDRFPLYWSEIEQQPGRYVWEDYDEAVRWDVRAGLRTNAILLGTAPVYADERGVPAGLFEPVFADGSDEPGRGKAINPANPWASFVYAAVNRYRPNGFLAQSDGWPRGAGIRVWEVWNEPDFTLFWRGSVEEYARMLKVAYLAARHADDHARIMVGGLVLFEQPGFLVDLLNLYRNDPSPVEGVFPFDRVALHAYNYPAASYQAVERVESLLAIYGLSDRRIWLNESGVAVWDDYPGPEWATRPDQMIWRATAQEQASYVIQSAAYAFMAGADAVFHFQLYDDCGNQPAGTTFPPHDGSLCDTGLQCWGDALGLMRNSRENVCFNQGPRPDTPRPAYSAFQTVGAVFASQPFVPLTASRGPLGDQVWLTFARPGSGELITVLWNESGRQVEAALPTSSAEAVLILAGGEQTTIRPGEDGLYHVVLNPATNRNHVGLPVNYMIGGPPVFLIQRPARPVVSVLPLLETSRTAFMVQWESSDPTLRRYEIYYRDETAAGDWVLWLESDTPGEALFVGGAGRTYSFFARGRLADDSWTADEPVVQARTTVE